MLTKQSIIRKCILAFIIIFVFVGFRFWSGYEEARGRDMMTLSLLSELSSELGNFYAERSAFPVALSELPAFVGRPMPLAYTPFSGDAKSECTSKVACPHYSIGFSLQTNAVISKGSHILTDEGLQQ